MIDVLNELRSLGEKNGFIERKDLFSLSCKKKKKEFNMVGLLHEVYELVHLESSSWKFPHKTS